MSTIRLESDLIKKEELVKQIKNVLKIIESCPKDMHFKVNIETTAIDSRLTQIADIILKSQEETDGQIEDLGTALELGDSDIENILQSLKSNFGDKDG